MAFSKIIFNGVTQMDVTGDTVAANNLLTGYTATGADGEQVVGAYVPSGGGGAEKKQITFYDYDGSIVDSYTSAEWANVTTLPANPSHTGLTAQGWNWTKAEINAQLLAMPDGDVNVGQMYITTSGDTEIDIVLDNADYLSPYLTVCPNGTVTVDWGDNSATDTLTGTSTYTLKYVQHVYASTGNYTIKLSTTNQVGFYQLANAYVSILLVTDAGNYMRYSRAYSSAIRAIRLGSGVTLRDNAFTNLLNCEYITIPDDVTSIGNYAFNNCYSLQSLTIPDGVTSIGSNTFQNCYSLHSIIIPNGVTSIGITAFSNCRSLNSLTIPNGVTSVGNNTFQNCYSLHSIAIPNNVTNIGNSAFNSCYSLDSMAIPNNVTSIRNSAFNACYALNSITISSGVTSIGDSTFSGCYSVRSLTIPSTVTSIGSSAFSNCYGMEEYHFLGSTPPTLGTNAFSSIQSYTTIYVPAASLTAYQTATNWSAYASYMVGETA